MLNEQAVYYLCDKVLKDTILDVFYLITMNDGGISKIDILREYQNALGVDSSTRKFRYTIDEAIATLMGTTFIDFFKEGTSDKYYLTSHGEIAREVMGELLNKKPDLLKTSKIVSAAIK